ncbi:RICIN domain-containing protein [Aquipuribacter hungaricus]|uniref:RICIN domain-containing protein n=1 Tax=Aquipuribacter hungaricus TaxID=545624 RepID=A0ABV7WC24_9MICO
MTPRCPTTEASQGDEGAAMMFVLVTMFIATSISLLLLGSIVSQVGPAQFAQKNVRTVHAAEAGLDVALGQVRAASATDPLDSTKVVGNRQGLPCIKNTKRGVLTGDLGTTPGALTYRVTIRYYATDPAGKDEAWRTANAMTCTTAGGPAITPRYALLQSEGAGAAVPRRDVDAGDRTVETVYDFQLTNTNVAGGLIHNYFDGNTASLDLCWKAGSAVPTVGTRLTAAACTPSDANQRWTWRSDFTIALSRTLDPAWAGSKLCAAAVGLTDPRQMQLQVCGAGFEQKWGYDDNGRFRARLNGTAYTSFCPVISQDNTSGSNLDASTAACNGSVRQTKWRPDASVGSGSVGNVTGTAADTQLQWVNYDEFGRCFDVSNWDVAVVSMIAYPCKQDPTSAVGWNQTLVWNGTTKQLYTRQGSTGQTFNAATGPRYCVRAPSTNFGYVTLRVCSTGSIPANEIWQVNRKIEGNYADSYTVVDRFGRCMAVGPPNAAVYTAWSSIVSATCDGSGRQKWNAPPLDGASTVRDTREVVGP